MSDCCPHCGLQYADLRTGLTYKEVYDMYWSGSDDPSDWKYKRRGTILGKWHQLKQELWARYLEGCELEHLTGQIPF